MAKAPPAAGGVPPSVRKLWKSYQKACADLAKLGADPSHGKRRTARDQAEQRLAAQKLLVHDLRNELIELYLSVVRQCGERLQARLPSEVQLDDLVQQGVFGLMDAMDQFEPERGFKFETFAMKRIRGAMLDYLRSLDWAPRMVRTRARKLQQARQAMYKRLGRQPTQKELSEALGVSRKELKRILRDGEIVGMTSLDRRIGQQDSEYETAGIDLITDHTADDPLDAVQRYSLRDWVTQGLSRAERLIVLLYYYEQMTMKEIGETLALSESRVSQMHSSILARLKARLRNEEEQLLVAG